MMSPVDHRQISSGDLYQARPDAVPSGFLTPPLSYEGRRDSITSSQASYSQSFGSSEYSAPNGGSMPATPICGRSPLSEGAFVDSIPYELVQNFPSQSMHVPPFTDGKESICTDDMYGSCVAFQSGMRSPQLLSFTEQHLMPLQPSYGYGPSLAAQMTEYNLGTTVVSSSEPTWDNMSTVAWPDMDRTRYNSIDHQDQDTVHLYRNPLEDAPPSWEPISTNPFDPETTIRADAMLDICMQIDSHGTQNVDAVDHAVSMFPQTPQEVSFKTEESVNIKTEVIGEPEARRRGGRIYVRQTGAKGVKREYRTGKVTKSRPSKQDKSYGQIAAPMKGGNNPVLVDLKSDIDLPYYRKTGKARLNGGSTRKQMHPCHFVDDATGAQCPKSFRRVEHLKRHVNSVHWVGEHPPIGGRCIICAKSFTRNDNCLAHYATHVRLPGKKAGRNKKFSVHTVLRDVARDPKVYDKLSMKWAHYYEQEEVEGYSSDECTDSE